MLTAGFYYRDFYDLYVYGDHTLGAVEWPAFSIPTQTYPRPPLSSQPIPLYTVTLAGSGQPAGVFRTTVKASAAYSFPYDIQLSGSFASIPGPGIRADYTVTSAIAGRAIIGSTTGTASTVVNLVQPNSLFLDYQ